ncbi:MAG: hypothetical protein ACI4QV_02175 [Acutalibacteraceae bacterium]
MSLILGADSEYPSNTKLTNGYCLYDWITKKCGMPSFWGRSINGENRISPEELAFLRDRNCVILPMYYDTREEGRISKDAASHGLRAVLAAKKIGVPAYAGKAIFAVIRTELRERDKWIERFAKILESNGYIPGIKANTGSFRILCCGQNREGFSVSFKDSKGCPSVIREAGSPADRFENRRVSAAPLVSCEKNAIRQNGTQTVSCGEITANANLILRKEFLNLLW